MNGHLGHVTAGNWKKGYRLTIEIGFVLSLLIVIGVFHVPYGARADFEISMVQQELVNIDEIQQTAHPPEPPPPPRAMTPIAVPDESLPDEEDLDLDATLDLNAKLDVPAPPPPAMPEEPEEEEPEEEIFVVVEDMPTIIGGLPRLYELIQYPAIARQAGMEGMVVVFFIVTPDGLPRDLTIQKSAGEVLDKAALDAVAQLTFTPGRQRGKAVPVRFSIPVRFRLEDR